MPRGPNKSLDAEAMAPINNRLWWKRSYGGFKKRARRTIAVEKLFQRLRMGEIQPTPPRHQELPRRGRHAIMHDHSRTALGENLGGHQAGRARADNLSGDYAASRRKG